MEKLRKVADTVNKALFWACVVFSIVGVYNITFFVIFRLKSNGIIFTVLPMSIPALDADSFRRIDMPETVGFLMSAVNSLWGATCAFVARKMMSSVKEGTPWDGTISRGLFTYTLFAVTGKFAVAILKEILCCVFVSGYRIQVGNLITGNIQPESLVFLAIILTLSFLVTYFEESEFEENRKGMRLKMRLEAINSLNDPIFISGFEMSSISNIEGSRHVCAVERIDGGKVQLERSDAEDWDSDPVREVSEVDAAVLAELDVLFRRYKMSFWQSLPTGQHVNDYAVTTYRFKFASNNTEFLFSTKQDLPLESEEALREIQDILDKYIAEQ